MNFFLAFRKFPVSLMQIHLKGLLAEQMKPELLTVSPGLLYQMWHSTKWALQGCINQLDSFYEFF